MQNNTPFCGSVPQSFQLGSSTAAPQTCKRLARCTVTQTAAKQNDHISSRSRGAVHALQITKTRRTFPFSLFVCTAALYCSSTSRIRVMTASASVAGILTWVRARCVSAVSLSTLTGKTNRKSLDGGSTGNKPTDKKRTGLDKCGSG